MGLALVGRGRELTVIAEFVSDCGASGGSLVLLGEPGAGKSALLDAAHREASGEGIRVLRATGAEFEAGIGYSGIHQALIPLLDLLPSLPGAHRDALTVALGLGSGDPPDRLMLAGAVLGLLSRAAEQVPLLLVVDDLHWFDGMSSWLLLFAARRFANHRIGLIGAARAGAGGYFDGAGLPELDVQPLSPIAAALLLELHHPHMAPRMRDRVLSEAQGNPLALLELPRALSQGIQAPQEELPEILTLNARLNRLFASRIAALPSETREVILLAALDGRGELFSQIDLISESESLSLLRPAEEQDLVRIDHDAGRFIFRHPLIRSAVVGLATCEEVYDAHRRLAQLFADDPGRQARHLAAATHIPNEQMAARLEGLAKEMQARGDNRGTADALTHSARLTVVPAERARRLSEAAFLAASGDLRKVDALLEEARLADPDLNTSLYFASAAAYMMTNGDGDLQTARRFLVTAIESQRDGQIPAPADALRHSVNTLGYLCYLSASPSAWRQFHDIIHRMAPQAGGLGLSNRVFGDPLRSKPRDLDALEHAIEGLDKELDQWKISEISGTAASVDRLAGCREALWRVVRDGRHGHATGHAVFALYLLAFDDFVSGRWSEIDDVINEGLEHCRSVPNPNGEWVLRHQAAMVAAGRGDEANVRSHTEWIYRWGSPRGIGLALNSANHARALAALGRGDFEQAYQLAAAISPAGTIEPYNLHALWVGMDLVEGAMRTGRKVEARAHVEAMDQADFDRVSSRLALLHRGSLALVHSEGDADELFLAALEPPDSRRWVFEHARVELAYGECLRRKRANVEARRPLRAAYETFRQLGAWPWTQRAERELRATGLDAPRERGRIDQLTAQELEIAQLAASGLTNKEIGARLLMSHRTVSSHLYHLFPKLGVTSRAALRDALDSVKDLALS
jgi:DNA-binding CsgD family transcriptional regulator